MQHPFWPLGVLLLCGVSFWAVQRADDPDRPRSLESVVQLGGSLVRDLQMPLQMLLDLSLSDEDEMFIGEQLALPYLERAVQDEDGRSLQRVGLRVVSTVRRDGIRYTFTLLPDAEPQAFAICGGYVFVTRGMFDRCETLAELAGVLGHEVAHVDLGHTAQNIGREKLGPGGEILDRMVDLARLSYSEEQEEEADRAGVLLAEGGGFFPSALLDLFRRLEERERLERGGRRDSMERVVESGLDAYLATHPSFSRRIEVVERVLAENESQWRGTVYTVDVGLFRPFP